MNKTNGIKRARKWVIIFSIISLLWCFASRIVEIIDVSNGIKFIVLSIGMVFCPMSVLGSWIGYIDRLFEVEGISNKTKINKFWWWTGIIIICSLGIEFLWSIKDIIDYVIYNWQLLDGIYYCIGIKMGMCLCRGILWLGSIKSRAVICGSEKTTKKIMLILFFIVVMIGMIYVSNVLETYAESVREDIWFDKMVEEYEEFK